MKMLIAIAVILCVACTGPRASAKRFAKPKYDLERRHPRDP